MSKNMGELATGIGTLIFLIGFYCLAFTAHFWLSVLVCAVGSAIFFTGLHYYRKPENNRTPCAAPSPQPEIKLADDCRNL